MLLWFVLSLMTALAVAGRDVSVKIFFPRLRLEEVAGLEMFWGLPVFAVGLALIDWPELDAVFWWNFLISFPVNVLAYFLYLRAITLSPLSLVIPFLAFTPLFMIVTGLVFLGERISLWGGGGVFLIAGGSYLLKSEEKDKGFWAPLRALGRDKGCMCMLSVAFLYSFGAVIGKQAILHSSPLFFANLFFLLFGLGLLAWLGIRGRVSRRLLMGEWEKGLWLGGFLGMHVICHALAISIATAVYMIAVKRSSILFTVLAGWLLLREEPLPGRICGALLMFAGMLLILLVG
ncbi:EamA family transporter [Thiovibrio sp. JS02]